MMRRTIFHIFNYRAILIYVSIILILMLTASDGISIFQMLGGINAYGSLDVLGIIRWNFCVLPPVVVSTLYMMEELSVFCTYTVIRSRNMMHWSVCRFAAIILVNALYPLLILIATFLWQSGEDRFGESMSLCLQFWSHTIMMSIISTALLVVFRTPKASLLAFVAVEGGTVVLGSVIPQVSKYMIGFWGMANNRNYLFSNGKVHLIVTICFMLAICAAICVAAISYLQKYNPAANPYR